MDNKVIKLPIDKVARHRRLVKRKLDAMDYKRAMDWFVFEIDGFEKAYTERELKEAGLLR